MWIWGRNGRRKTQAVPQYWVWWSKGGGGVLAGCSPVGKGDAVTLIIFTFSSQLPKNRAHFFSLHIYFFPQEKLMYWNMWKRYFPIGMTLAPPFVVTTLLLLRWEHWTPRSFSCCKRHHSSSNCLALNNFGRVMPTLLKCFLIPNLSWWKRFVAAYKCVYVYREVSFLLKSSI